MTELVTDVEVLKKMEPSYELLKAILSFKGMMSGEVLELARKIVRQVIEDLRRRLAKDVRQALWGRLNKQRRSRLKVAAESRLAADDPREPQELRPRSGSRSCSARCTSFPASTTTCPGTSSWPSIAAAR